MRYRKLTSSVPGRLEYWQRLAHAFVSSHVLCYQRENSLHFRSLQRPLDPHGLGSLSGNQSANFGGD